MIAAVRDDVSAKIAPLQVPKELAIQLIKKDSHRKWGSTLEALATGIGRMAGDLQEKLSDKNGLS